MISVKIHNASGLKRFIQKLNQANTILSEHLLESVCKFAVAKGEELYLNHNHKSIKMAYEVMGDRAQVTANGEAVAFFEFGTGRVGEGTYPDDTKLPESGVPITGNWEYYYPSASKATRNGEEGWFFGASWQTGRHAEHEMWDLSLAVKEEVPKIINKLMNGGAK